MSAPWHERGLQRRLDTVVVPLTGATFQHSLRRPESIVGDLDTPSARRIPAAQNDLPAVSDLRAYVRQCGPRTSSCGGSRAGRQPDEAADSLASIGRRYPIEAEVL